MKTIAILFLFILLGVNQTVAQSILKPDLIYKSNNTILESSIEEVSSGIVRYKLFAQPNGSVRQVPLKDVVKIRYANGKEETYENGIVKMSAIPAAVVEEKEQPAAHTPAERIVEPVKAKEEAFVRKEETLPTENLRPSDQKQEVAPAKSRPLLSFTIGADGLYMVGNKNWVDDKQRTGFRQGVGASAVFDFPLASFLALSLRGGYYMWEVSRDYVENNETLFSSKTSFTQIPLHVGIKIYPYKSIYLMPEGGIHLYTFDYNDGTDFSEKLSGNAVAYGGSIGVELRGKVIMADISARYHILSIKDLGNGFTQMGAANYAVVRLGIGFVKRK